nr:puromycin-sensitive aminopeptidase-like isoform X2 [Tanacetum cinerariifolium]
MPLSTIYHDGKLETVASGGQPVYTIVLRVTKIIYLGKPDDPTFHAGAETCYYRSIFDSPNKAKVPLYLSSHLKFKCVGLI